MWAVRAQRSATPNHGLTTEPLETRKAAVHLISRKELASQRKTEKATYKPRTCPCNQKHNSTTDKMFLGIAFNKSMRSSNGMRLLRYLKKWTGNVPLQSKTQLYNRQNVPRNRLQYNNEIVQRNATATILKKWTGNVPLQSKTQL